MPSIRYINQSAPFWDFVASLESQGSQHPLFNRGESSSDEEQTGPWGPWGPWSGRHWHRGPMPHHPHHRGPPPAGQSGEEAPAGPPPGYAASPDTVMGDNEKGAAEKKAEGAAGEAGPSSQSREGEPKDGEGCRGRRGGCHRGPGSFKARRCGGPGGWGGRRGPFAFGGPCGPGAAPWAAFLQNQIFGDSGNSDNARDGAEQADFKPELDVFDTEGAYVIHVALAGAKKEDVGVNWDPEKSELGVAGVIYRPGDEDFIKSLAMDGRRVGPFEATVRLGSRANPAQVDAEAITAKMEDGVLIVEVPKLDKDYVEIKKVDIE